MKKERKKNGFKLPKFEIRNCRDMIGLTIEEFEKISKDEVLLSQLKSLEVELSDIKVDFFVVVASAIKERKLLGPVDNYFSKRYIPSR